MMKYKPEIKNTQKWLENEIAGKGICPPLIKLLSQNKNQNGQIEWSRLIPEKIDIQSFYNLKPTSKELLSKVSEQYFSLIKKATTGIAPLTAVYILPDFSINPDYDKFLLGMKLATLSQLLADPELIKKAVSLSTPITGNVNDIVPANFNQQEGLVFLATNLIEGTFNPVFFYGKPLENRDLIDFGETRGPVDRQKVLSRAPYYLLQFVNVLPSETYEFIGKLNRPKLFAHNNEVALNTDLKKHQTKMLRYREGK